MNTKELKNFALAVYKKKVPTNFDHSIDDMEGALRAKFQELAPNFDGFRRNKLDIFEIIQTVVDDVLPQRIKDRISIFADVKTVAQGQKAQFKKKMGRQNVKRFITQVGLGGGFERVRLDVDLINVTTHAIGGAAYVEFESFLDGTMDFTELTNLILDGMEDKIYEEIYAAMIKAFDNLPAANKVSTNSFVIEDFRKVIRTVSAYGNATIICTPEFASTITPATGYIGDADKADMRDKGYIGKFEGANIFVLPQSFEEADNVTKIFNPQYAFIVPSGASDEKIVKVSIEGQTVVEDSKNAARQMVFEAYKKFGTVVLSTNQIGIYKNTSL
ncbi:hypothetical protein [Paenibacillus tianjinensis]|uniref:Phage capsid family protein n=1 Tax=Paenibacillus tianjinensis TaxID=2810347 RepID=A0ABX7L7Q2_9BACL|nr:hypothetical protein [Paenibacillus tianjinensis]QSF43276.1 hypothetical protein JRJ22_18590 [Paenibacillus tianjinensis]